MSVGAYKLIFVIKCARIILAFIFYRDVNVIFGHMTCLLVIRR